MIRLDQLCVCEATAKGRALILPGLIVIVCETCRGYVTEYDQQGSNE